MNTFLDGTISPFVESETLAGWLVDLLDLGFSVL